MYKEQQTNNNVVEGLKISRMRFIIRILVFLVFSMHLTITGSTHWNTICNCLNSKVSEEDNRILLALLAPVTDMEIKNVVFDCDPNKSLGPDGMMGEFFQTHWDTVGNDVTKAIQDFFTSGKLVRNGNRMQIAVNPKTTDPTNL